MKTWQIVVVALVLLTLVLFFGNKAFANNKLATDVPLTNPDELVGKVDLWCENGKYYKRTVTKIYGAPTMEELTKPQFDVLVSQGIGVSGCE